MLLGTMIRSLSLFKLYPIPNPESVDCSYTSLSEDVRKVRIRSLCAENKRNAYGTYEYVDSHEVFEKLYDHLMDVEDTVEGLKLEDFN
jgi:hypothetical protein